MSTIKTKPVGIKAEPVGLKTEAKRRQLERTVLDDVADLEERRRAIEERRTVVARTLSACRQRVAAAEEQRKGELRLAIDELRDANTDGYDEQIAGEQPEMQRLRDQIDALRVAAGGVDNQIAALHRERRSEFVQLARENAEEVVAPAQQRFMEAARELIAATRENAGLWQSAFAGADRGRLAPELPVGARVDARIPGGSIADRCTIARANRVNVNGAELFRPIGTLAEIVDHLDRLGNVGMPASVVGPDALQGRPGRYLDTILGHVYELDLRSLKAPNEVDVSVDEYGMAGLRWIAPLPAGSRASRMHQRTDWDPATRTFRPAARTTPAANTDVTESEAA